MYKTQFIKFIFAVSVAVAIYLVFINFIYYNDDWKERTTPLSRETIETLCNNFTLRDNDYLCSQTRDIYAPDFYQVIRDKFRPYEAYDIDVSESATFEEVEEKIGVFRIECDEVIQTSDGFAFYRCQYDLHGDQEFIIGILFKHPENAVFRINTPMGFDGE